jgi:hypothetical protein
MQIKIKENESKQGIIGDTWSGYFTCYFGNNYTLGRSFWKRDYFVCCVCFGFSRDIVVCGSSVVKDIR